MIDKIPCVIPERNYLTYKEPNYSEVYNISNEEQLKYCYLIHQIDKYTYRKILKELNQKNK